MRPAADAARPTDWLTTPDYPLECYRCGKTGNNFTFGLGNNRRCPDCGSYEIHPPKV